MRPVFASASRRVTASSFFLRSRSILIERSAYEAVGGHLSVRDKFVEDIYLASRVKDSGRRIRVAIAQGRATLIRRAKAGEPAPGLAQIRATFEGAETDLDAAEVKLNAAAVRIEGAGRRLDEARVKARRANRRPPDRSS